jgi:hypothetical protein
MSTISRFATLKPLAPRDPAPPSSSPIYNEAYRTYWALGDHCWKQQGIDGKDHRHGKWVYDQGLHAPTKKEPGYWEMVSNPNVLTQDLKVDLYQGIQKIACRHFDIRSRDQAGKEAIGQFFADRDPRSGGGKAARAAKTDLFCHTPETNEKRTKLLRQYRPFDSVRPLTTTRSFSKEEQESHFKQEFSRFKKAHPGWYEEDEPVEFFIEDYKIATEWLNECGTETNRKMDSLNAYVSKKSKDLGLSHPVAVFDHDPDPRFHSASMESYRVEIRYKCTQEELVPIVTRLFNEYNKKMSTATTRDEKLYHIADLFQMLEWIHAFADGQGRTDWLVLNKELCRHGFTPAIFENPYVSSWCSLEEWIYYLEDGMKRWQMEKEKLAVCQWKEKFGDLLVYA